MDNLQTIAGICSQGGVWDTCRWHGPLWLNFDSHLNQLRANREVDSANSCKLRAKQLDKIIAHFSLDCGWGLIYLFLYNSSFQTAISRISFIKNIIRYIATNIICRVLGFELFKCLKKKDKRNSLYLGVLSSSFDVFYVAEIISAFLGYIMYNIPNT